MFYIQNIGFFIFLVMLGAAMTYFCRQYIKIMDYASERSSHEGMIPRSGGIAIVITFCTAILIYYFARTHYFVGQKAFWGLFVSALMVALVSLYDDITNKGLLFKIFIQLLGAFILIIFGLTIRELTIPFFGKVQLSIYSYPLTILWIVGITNAFNFMDGLNGLAAGTAIVVSISFAFITYILGSGFVFHVSYIIAASCIGFIIFNYPNASIFMGDVGSTFLGFCFGALAILAANYDLSHTPFVIIPILFANFILETLFTFIKRLIQKQPVYKAHKTHPYQLLNQMRIPAKVVTLFYLMQNIVLFVICIFYIHATEKIKMIIIISIICSYLAYFIKVNQAARKMGIINGGFNRKGD